MEPADRRDVVLAGVGASTWCSAGVRQLHQLVVHRPGLQWRNTARRGARIPGVPYANFDDALRWLGGGSAAPVPSVLAGRHAAGGAQCLNADRLRAALAGTRPFAEQVLRAALAAVAAIEALPDARLGAGQAEHPEVAAALRTLDALQELLSKFPEETGILEEGRTRLELYKAQAAEAQVARLEEHARRLLLGREFAWALAEGAWFLARSLEVFETALAEKVAAPP